MDENHVQNKQKNYEDGEDYLASNWEQLELAEVE